VRTERRGSEAVCGTVGNSDGPWTLAMKAIQLLTKGYFFKLKAFGTRRTHEEAKSENS